MRQPGAKARILTIHVRLRGGALHGRDRVRRRQLRRRQGVDGGDQRARAGHLQGGGHGVAGRLVALGVGSPAVEFDEQLARLHGLPLAHMQGAHGGHVDGGDGLGVTGWNDLAARMDDDVDFSDNGPQHDAADEQHQHPGSEAQRGRHGPLLQRQRGRQEGRLVLAEHGAAKAGAVVPAVPQHLAVAFD